MDKNERRMLTELYQELAKCRKELTTKDRDIRQLQADVESWKGAHSVASTDRDIASAQCKKDGAEIQRLRERVALLNSLLGEALRHGYLNASACSPTWLAEARKAVTP
jgi:peptidoglycan hydrolase CwlO-like protein